MRREAHTNTHNVFCRFRRVVLFPNPNSDDGDDNGSSVNVESGTRVFAIAVAQCVRDVLCELCIDGRTGLGLGLVDYSGRHRRRRRQSYGFFLSALHCERYAERSL